MKCSSPVITSWPSSVAIFLSNFSSCLLYRWEHAACLKLFQTVITSLMVVVYRIPEVVIVSDKDYRGSRSGHRRNNVVYEHLFVFLADKHRIFSEIIYL